MPQPKPPAEIIPPPALVDSPDFTDEEVRSAEAVKDTKALAAQLGHFCRPSCEARLEPKGYALRRRDGVHYSRVTLACANGHEVTRVFRLDWLKGDGT